MNRGVGAAIAGGGFGVRVMLPCLRAAGFAVRAVCSRTPARFEAEARAQGVPRVTADYMSLIEDADIDLICVATPPALHAEMAIAALRAGKHLLCEKPLARTAAEALQIAEAGRGRAGVQAVDHQLRFHPNFARIRHAIAAGEIGTVRSVHVCYASAARADPALPLDWWSDATAGGGQLNALGSHMVDTLRWWLADEVVDARGSLATFTARRTAPGGGSGPVTADEYAAFQLQFARGTLASVVVSAVDPTDSGLRIEIVGAAGRLLLDGFDSLSLAIGRTAPRDISVADTLIGQPTIGLNAWRTSLVRYGEHLLECIRDGRACSGATLEEGVTIQRVLESVRGPAAAAIREGKRQW